MLKALGRYVHAWCQDVKGLAAAEFALIFPLLFTLFIGVYELGNGVLINQKVIASSQMVADLLTRVRTVTDDQLEEAVMAGQLALNPYDTGDLGFDIVSLRFDAEGDPEIVWRETRNMDPIVDIEERVEDIAVAGDGIFIVSVKYPYQPVFSGFVIDEINMIEMAFAHGRRQPVVCREPDDDCV